MGNAQAPQLVGLVGAPAGEVEQQVAYLPGGQDVQQVNVEGLEITGAPDQVPRDDTPLVAATPTRVNVSHEIFAKLVAGAQLTPEETAQLSGQEPAPEQAMPEQPVGSPQVQAAASPGSAQGSKEKEKKEQSGSKESFKVSKKKEKGCC